MRIVGVTMCKDQDLFIEQVVRNARDFCDEYLVLDNGSTDRTQQILRRLVAELHIRVVVYQNLSESHAKAVEPLVGHQDTWLFSVDGDDIYDPEGLKRLRVLMDAGEFEDAYIIRGQYVHLTDLDPPRTWASGWYAPAVEQPTNLYNMQHVKAWPADGERIMLYPRTRVMQGPDSRDYRHTAKLWDECDFRCLHTRFLKQSTDEDLELVGRRPTPMQIAGHGHPTGDRGDDEGACERNLYRQGSLVTINVESFFQ